MAEQGYYDVTLHSGPGIVQAHVTFPFGQWAELGYWVDDIAPDEHDVLTVTFHPHRPPLIPCTPEDVDESAGQAELHSVRAELHEPQRWQEIEAAGIEELELGVRAYNILKRNGIDTCGQLLGVSEEELDELGAYSLGAGREKPYQLLRGVARSQVLEARAGLRQIHRNLEEPLRRLDRDDLLGVLGIDPAEFGRGLGEIDGTGDPSTGTED